MGLLYDSIIGDTDPLRSLRSSCWPWFLQDIPGVVMQQSYGNCQSMGDSPIINMVILHSYDSYVKLPEGNLEIELLTRHGQPTI